MSSATRSWRRSTCNPAIRCSASTCRRLASVWVGQRRWNLVLGNDTEIWLPEEDAVDALHRSAKLEQSDKLLSREFGVVDMRLPDKLYLRKRSPAESAPDGPV